MGGRVVGLIPVVWRRLPHHFAIPCNAENIFPHRDCEMVLQGSIAAQRPESSGCSHTEFHNDARLNTNVE